MRLRWFGQPALRLTGAEHTVGIDPLGELPEGVRSRGIHGGHPAVTGIDADLVLVTHEHLDPNGTEGIGGDPQIVRLAGTRETPIGTLAGIASEHDPESGTRRGPNAISRLHSGTPAATFPGPHDPFVDAIDARVERVAGHEADLDGLTGGDGTGALVLEPPGS